jgi:hypothetical protein
MNLSIRKDDDGFWLYLDGSKQALVKLESQSGMIHEMLEEALASDSKSDGIAQGRREAAEAVCNYCGMCIPNPRKRAGCWIEKVILGTASTEKTGKGEL